MYAAGFTLFKHNMKLQGIYLFQFTGNEATTILQSTGHHLSIAHPLAFAAFGLNQSVQISGDN